MRVYEFDIKVRPAMTANQAELNDGEIHSPQG
jgi:hypothetical protein